MVRGFPTSHHKGRDKASRMPRGIENSCRNMVVTLTPIGRGVLGVTLGETSSCKVDEEICWCPFDIEARALKILSDRLPVLTWEPAKETIEKLLTERDEALDDAKGVILAKRDLERALEEATTEKLNAEASIRRLSDQGKRVWEEASKLSSEVEIVGLQAELEVPRAEPAQLRAASSKGAEGDASGKASGPLSGESRALIISGYLLIDVHRQREEFERTHYVHGGFVKALLEDVALYPKLDLSSLYGSS
ncbi:hypothetical protein ACLOJK_023190 [Asimina triloba]